MSGLNKIYIDQEKPKYYLPGLIDLGSRGRLASTPHIVMPCIQFH